MYVENRTKSPIFTHPVYLTPPMKGLPLEFGIVVRGPECFYDGAIRWSKMFSDTFSRFDTIPAVTDSHPPSHPASHVAVAITLNAKASSLKTEIWVHNYSPSCAQKYLGKFTSYMTFGAHKLVCSEPFLDFRNAKFEKCCRHYIAKYGKNLCRCTSTFLAVKYCGGFLLKSQLCAQTFPPIFELFTIFGRNFPKIVAPGSNRNANYLVRLKKTVKTESKSTHKP